MYPFKILLSAPGIATVRPPRLDYAYFVFWVAMTAGNSETHPHIAGGAACSKGQPQHVPAAIIVCPRDKVLIRFSQFGQSMIEKVAYNERASRTRPPCADALLPMLIWG
jgi:hypothetical protein